MYNVILDAINNLTHREFIQFDIFTLNITIQNNLLASIITLTFCAILITFLIKVVTLLPKTLNQAVKRKKKLK